MRTDAGVTLFLGAGVSVPLPAGAPLFAEVRDACALRAGVDTTRWPEDDKRRLALENIIPEVFLKAIMDVGYRLEEPLRRAVQPEGWSDHADAAWNSTHALAAEVLAAGGSVFTTNWDTRVEAASLGTGLGVVEPAVYRQTPPPPRRSGYGKLHGCVTKPGSLLFASPHIIEPLEEEWHRALVDCCRGRFLFVAGYAGADVDLYRALREGMEVARATFWFEGEARRSTPYEESPQAGYEAWRFLLDGHHDDPAALPDHGRHLVWCGRGQSHVSDPSEGLLSAFGDGQSRLWNSSTVHPARPWRERFDDVYAEVKQAPRDDLALLRRLMFSAEIHNRLTARYSAAIRYAGVLVLGKLADKKIAARQIGNLVLLRRSRFRRFANRVAVIISRDSARKRFLRLQSGHVDRDSTEAANVALNGHEDRTIDACLDLAMNARWVTDITISERIARAQFDRSMAENLASRERDWPERVARSTYEIGMALSLQGRYYELDELCRGAYMRVAGSKWAGWEYSLRALPRFAEGEYAAADQHLETAVELLHLEGFHDFTRSLIAGRASCRRMLGDMKVARKLLREAADWRGNGQGTLSIVAAEDAELSLAEGDLSRAIELWRGLCESGLPLWQGVAHLRLAEHDVDTDRNAGLAISNFDDVKSRWGIIRTSALINNATEEQVAAESGHLGPVGVFLPRGPWYF